MFASAVGKKQSWTALFVFPVHSLLVSHLPLAAMSHTQTECFDKVASS